MNKQHKIIFLKKKDNSKLYYEGQTIQNGILKKQNNPKQYFENKKIQTCPEDR